jgi:hypothetical protein
VSSNIKILLIFLSALSFIFGQLIRQLTVSTSGTCSGYQVSVVLVGCPSPVLRQQDWLEAGVSIRHWGHTYHPTPKTNSQIAEQLGSSGNSCLIVWRSSVWISSTIEYPEWDISWVYLVRYCKFQDILKYVVTASFLCSLLSNSLFTTTQWIEAIACSLCFWRRH